MGGQYDGCKGQSVKLVLACSYPVSGSTIISKISQALIDMKRIISFLGMVKHAIDTAQKRLKIRSVASISLKALAHLENGSNTKWLILNPDKVIKIQSYNFFTMPNFNATVLLVVL